ncbi:U32 family peptidase [Floridanema aerugineum]|uniref:U32 family peptidase n=1 Tax=Floridaenema aerugineum BLCC-F46 TaxID=3153654 RepID=A0ABV4X7S6_9CYAN
MWKPELLAPAKNLERLKVAIAYGADAIYLGGQNYGLRARADNFTDYELEQAVVFAHQHHAKIYVTLNAFLHDSDFVGLAEYCHFLESIGVDAVIVSDLGVIRAIRNSSNLNIHLSTQASCLNSYAGLLWKQMGVKRLIVGRELTIAEAGAIREKSGIEVEMFTHGAMCMAYSGHCTISNFTAGRDSNRGGCIQSCRLPYHLETEDKKSDDLVSFMSSRDLWGIYQIGEFFQHQICSLKIEGRMKSSFYVGLTCKIYRQLIDAYADGTLNAEMLQVAARELQSVPNRDYFSGSLETPAGKDSVFGQLSGINTGTYEYLGLVVDTTPDEIVLQLVEPLTVGEEIEIIPFQGEAIRGRVDRLFSITGESVEFLRQDSIARIPKFPTATKAANIAKFNVVRFKSAVKEVAHAI